MIFIWTDESDAQGKYYSNFYGGILILSQHYEEVLSRLRTACSEAGVTEEIKWQKVTEYTLERYKLIVDELFRLLAEGKVKLRIFFRKSRVETAGLTSDKRRKGYQLLYYQFIKHAFGLKFCNPTGAPVRVRLFLDDMPLKKEDRQEFLQAIYDLSDTKDFKRAGIIFSDIAEVDSKRHLPLQVMDLVLGAMCFRLNDKHKIRGLDGKRAKRTIVKEKLYKYINSKIRDLRPGFNIGMSTGIEKMSDRWEQPYRHWNFVPANAMVNEQLPVKHEKKKDSPVQPT